jgi:hypothetical protein
LQKPDVRGNVSRVLRNQEQRRADTMAVIGKWDQADALLLLESGWTLERIGEKIGKSFGHVDKLLRFGRFISFSCSSGTNHHPGDPTASIPPNLTERLFRAAWSKTLKRSPEGKKYSEQDRFDQARQILD